MATSDYDAARYAAIKAKQQEIAQRYRVIDELSRHTVEDCPAGKHVLEVFVPGYRSIILTRCLLCSFCIQSEANNV